MACMPFSMVGATFGNALGAGAPQKSMFEILLRHAPETWETAIQMVLLSTVFIGIISGVAMFCIWWERKVAGHIEWPPGAQHAGASGEIQSPADRVQLLVKEELVSSACEGLVARLAPY